MRSQGLLSFNSPRSLSQLVTKYHKARCDGRTCYSHLSPPVRLSPHEQRPTGPGTTGTHLVLVDSNASLGLPVRRFTSWTRFLTPTGLRAKDQNAKYGSGGDQELGETETMHQEGHEIREVPLAVLKSTDGESNKMPSQKLYIDLDVREEAAFVEGFNNFISPQQVLKMLEVIPSQEVTPFVSLRILKKLFELENNFVFRNDGFPYPWTTTSENSKTDTFARTAIVSRLVDIIVSTEDTTIILATLDVLRCEPTNDKLNQESATLHTFHYRTRLFENVLLRVTQGKLSVSEVCQAVISLGKVECEMGKSLPKDLIDKLWIGIFEKSDDIGVENLTQLFRVIPYFKKSRRLVLNLAESKVLSFWWKMDSQVVAEICEILITDKTSSRKNQDGPHDFLGVSTRVLKALSRCTSLNMHKVTEKELLTIVKSFHSLHFCDREIEKALNKYMKAKCLKISDPNLVTAILDYCKQFHLRIDGILEAASEFIVSHKGDKGSLSPSQITSIISAYGHLDFQPPNGVKFWQIMETCLNEKFVQFRPKDIIDVFLACVYLLKFPINFVERLFSPYFLDRLHTSEADYNQLQRLRTRLKLLDAALTIECPSKYNGPMLPRDFTSRSVFVDGRILRMRTYLEDVIREVIGVKCSVESSVVLPGLPLNALYIADILISSVNTSESDRFNFMRNRIFSRLNSGVTPAYSVRDLTVVLLHLPEHYSRCGEHLIGSEAMRIRHLKLIGFKVATMKLSHLAEIKVHPTQVHDYVKEKLKLAGYPVRK